MPKGFSTTRRRHVPFVSRSRPRGQVVLRSVQRLSAARQDKPTNYSTSRSCLKPFHQRLTSAYRNEGQIGGVGFKPAVRRLSALSARFDFDRPRGMLFQTLHQALPKIVFRHLLGSIPGGKTAPAASRIRPQIVECRNDQAMGEVSGDTKNDEAAWLGWVARLVAVGTGHKTRGPPLCR